MDCAYHKTAQVFLTTYWKIIGQFHILFLQINFSLWPAANIKWEFGKLKSTVTFLSNKVVAYLYTVSKKDIFVLFFSVIFLYFFSVLNSFCWWTKTTKMQYFCDGMKTPKAKNRNQFPLSLRLWGEKAYRTAMVMAMSLWVIMDVNGVIFWLLTLINFSCDVEVSF